MNAHQVGDAHAEVENAMRSRLDDLAALQRIARGEDIDEFSNDETLALGLAYGIPGPIPDSQLEEEAGERLDELPLAVERTVRFEIVLGTGGPDDRLVFECERVDGNGPEPEAPATYEIRRVFYRYSWTGSAEVELTGEDRVVAEEFARRVVPELVE